MSIVEYNKGLPDEIRKIVWARKEKYKIDGCCFGIELEEVECPRIEPFRGFHDNNHVIGDQIFWLLLIYIIVGIIK